MGQLIEKERFMAAKEAKLGTKGPENNNVEECVPVEGCRPGRRRIILVVSGNPQLLMEILNTLVAGNKPKNNLILFKPKP